MLAKCNVNLTLYTQCGNGASVHHLQLIMQCQKTNIKSFKTSFKKTRSMPPKRSVQSSTNKCSKH
jgi:hypothetical protein